MLHILPKYLLIYITESNCLQTYSTFLTEPLCPKLEGYIYVYGTTHSLWHIACPLLDSPGTGAWWTTALPQPSLTYLMLCEELLSTSRYIQKHIMSSKDHNKSLQRTQRENRAQEGGCQTKPASNTSMSTSALLWVHIRAALQSHSLSFIGWSRFTGSPYSPMGIKTSWLTGGFDWKRLGM